MQPLNKAIFLALLLVCSLSCSKSKEIRKLKNSNWELVSYRIDTEVYDKSTQESTFKENVNVGAVDYLFLSLGKPSNSQEQNAEAWIKLAKSYDLDNAFFLQEGLDSLSFKPGDFGNFKFNYKDGSTLPTSQYVLFNDVNFEVKISNNEMDLRGQKIKLDDPKNLEITSNVHVIFKQVQEVNLPD